MFTVRVVKFTLSEPPSGEPPMLVKVPTLPDPSTGLGPPAKAKVTVPEVGTLVASAPKIYGTPGTGETVAPELSVAEIGVGEPGNQRPQNMLPTGSLP